MNLQHPRSLARLVSLAGFASLAACNGNNGPYYNNFQNPGPCSYHNAKVALVSPAVGATGVPDLLPQVIVATNTTFSTYDAVLTGSIAGVVQQVPFGAFISAALPAGTTAPFPGAIYYASTNPGNVAFDSKTAVSVSLNDLSTDCSPGPSIGSFTVL